MDEVADFLFVEAACEVSGALELLDDLKGMKRRSAHGGDPSLPAHVQAEMDRFKKWQD